MFVKKLLLVTICTQLALTTAACEQYGTKQTIGTLGGAALGGWLGSMIGSGTGQQIAIAAGVFLGAIIGNEIGKTMDEVDRQKAADAQVAAQNARVGDTVQWNNPDTGNHGDVTVLRDGYDQNGRYCREFHHKIYIGSELKEGVGVACENPDGTWQIMS